MHFPAKRVAAAALLQDEAGRLLLVKTHYDRHWNLPGGIVEQGESPAAGCRREVREELGLEVGHLTLVTVDWVPPLGDRGDGLVLVHRGGLLTPDQQAAVVLQEDELEAWAMAVVDDLPALAPAWLVRRITGALAGIPYLEEGHARG